MHLIRSVADADEAGVDVSTRQERVLRDAGGAVDLDGAVDDAGGHAGHHDLGDGNQVARDLVALAVHPVGGLQRQSRACAISQNECAMSSRTEPCSASGLPKAVRETARWHINSSARWAQPISRMQ